MTFSRKACSHAHYSVMHDEPVMQEKKKCTSHTKLDLSRLAIEAFFFLIQFSMSLN